VYRSTQSGTGYTKITSSLDTAESYTDTTVTGGQTYYYVVTSVSTSGVESAYSAQVTAAVPTT
jgi:fibronectin type 3 domain-containing protein